MRRVALLAGNSEFRPDSGITNLRFPPADVERMSELLKDREIGRFDSVQSLVNKAQPEVLEALVELLKDNNNAFCLFYYSGHGIPSEGAGRLYLATSDTRRATLPISAIAYETITSLKEEFFVSRFAIILDCCFAGLGGLRDRGALDDRLRASAEGHGVFFLGAAGSTNVAKEDETLGHGILTAGIVEGLKTGQADVDKDGLVTGPDLFKWCREFANSRGAPAPVQANMIQGGDLTIAYSRVRIAEPALQVAVQPHLAQILKIFASLAAAVVVIGGLLGYWNAWNTYKPEITNHSEATVPSLDWQRVRAVAESKSIPLPEKLPFTIDAKGVPMPFRHYLGAWDGAWGGARGRQVLLVVLKVEPAIGRASGIIAAGPPPKDGVNQDPAYFGPFSGAISEAGLTYFLGKWRNTFELVGTNTLSGQEEMRDDRGQPIVFRSFFQRIP